MRLVGRLLGYFLILLTVCSFGLDLLTLIQTGSFRFAALGQLWFRFDRAGLNTTQAVIERYIAPELWDWVFAPVLQWPAVFVFLVPGVILLLLFGRSRSKRRFY